jgi:hypothetical protein
MNTFAACRSYLDKLPPAVSGAGGHPATFRAACECVRFGLGDADALALLLEYNRRCSPPWTEKELAHKLADARRKAGGQVRTFRQSAPAVRVVWPMRKPISRAEPVKVQPLPAPVVVAAPVVYPDGCPHPGGWLPERFIDALQTWTAFRTDPFWRDHPQLLSSKPYRGSSVSPTCSSASVSERLGGPTEKSHD